MMQHAITVENYGSDEALFKRLFDAKTGYAYVTDVIGEFFQPEIRQWFADNHIRMPVLCGATSPPSISIHFKREADAVLFKMRWM